MKIEISSNALQWFKEEMAASPGDEIRFFARYGGSSTIHEGFSIGVMKEEADEIAYKETIEEIQFYIEERDKWYFAGYDLVVSINEQTGELHYDYIKQEAK